MADGSPISAPALSLDDQVFVNAMAAAVVYVVFDPKDQAIWREIARDVRPNVTRDHRYLSPLINSFTAWDTALDVMAAQPAPDRMDMDRARVRLVGELQEFFRWRCCLADAALQRRQSATSER